MSDLNLDPRSRAVAGAGMQVVQNAREALAGSAWQQAGEIERANALLARAQLARAVTSSLVTRHLNVASDGSYLQMTAPLHARVTLTLGGSKTTLRGAVTASALPPASLAGAFRKLIRPRGSIGRQISDTTFGVVARLNTPPASGSNALQTRPEAAAPQGMVAFDSVATTVRVATFAAAPAREQSGWHLALAATATSTAGSGTARIFEPIVLAKDPNLPIVLSEANKNVPPLISLPATATELATFADSFGAAAKLAGTVLQVAAPAAATFVPLGGTAALTTTRSALSARLDPERTIAARAGARVPLRTTGDPLSGVRNAPSFPQAMYEPLAELSPEWMFPGISGIIQNSATALAPNDAFVEAYLIALNEEMSRELLWRGYPLDLKATFFQNFWSATQDIPAIGSFPAAGGLGTHVAGAGDANRIILLVRAQLFARYPNAVVAAVRAQWSGSVRTLTSTRQYPLFRGEIGSDIRFYGFDIPDARGNPDPSKNDAGWYFAIEQHATEPRFGLEPDASTAANPTWNDLSWNDVTLSGAFLDTATAPATPARENVSWNAGAATMAFILERRPVRVAMHALALLGPAASS
jgi:hypothetical protein